MRGQTTDDRRRIYPCLAACVHPSSVVRCLSSEIQSAFACRLGQGFHPAVIEVTTAVEYHVLDALLLGALRDQLADRLRRVDAGAGLEAFARRLLDRGSRREGDALVVVDHLGIDM